MLREAVQREMLRGGWTQAGLARRARVSRANLCDWLRGRSSIGVETLERMMVVLRLTVARKGGTDEERRDRDG